MGLCRDMGLPPSAPSPSQPRVEGQGGSSGAVRAVGLCVQQGSAHTGGVSALGQVAVRGDSRPPWAGGLCWGPCLLGPPLLLGGGAVTAAPGSQLQPLSYSPLRFRLT